MDTYTKYFVAGWHDMDFNSHMRNTAYLEKAADIRMMCFSEHGFPMAEFLRLKFGPVILKDEVEYHKEVGLMEELKVTMALSGLSDDGSRALIRNDIFRKDERLCARITSVAAWLDFSLRRLIVPPPAMLAMLLSLPRSTDFTPVPSSLKVRN